MVQPQLHLGHDVIYKQASTLTGLAKEVTLNTNSNCFAKDGNCSQIKLGYEDAAPPLNMCTQMLWHYQPWDRGCTTTNPVCADIAPSPTSDVKLLLHHPTLGQRSRHYKPCACWCRPNHTQNSHQTFGISRDQYVQCCTSQHTGSSQPPTPRSGNTQAHSLYYQTYGNSRNF